MKTSKSKTFQQGVDCAELIGWFMDQFETNDYFPEGTNWSGGEPGPHDPVSELKHKYIITITKVETNEQNNGRTETAHS